MPLRFGILQEQSSVGESALEGHCLDRSLMVVPKCCKQVINKPEMSELFPFCWSDLTILELSLFMKPTPCEFAHSCKNDLVPLISDEAKVHNKKERIIHHLMYFLPGLDAYGAL